MKELLLFLMFFCPLLLFGNTQTITEEVTLNTLEHFSFNSSRIGGETVSNFSTNLSIEKNTFSANINDCNENDLLNSTLSNKLFTEIVTQACPEVCVDSETYIDCENNSTQLDATCSSGDIASILWTTTNGNIVSGENTLTPTVNAEGTYTVTLTSSDGCEVSDNVLVSNSLQVITLASILPYAADQSLSDIWGWVDADGNEYAIFGIEDTDASNGINAGIAIVDVTDPYNPVEVEFINIPGLNSSWWDIKTCGDYAYYITEDNNPPGLNIIDLSNLPTSASVTTTQLGVGYTDSHDIYIDENCTGYIFGATTTGVGSGTLIIDIAANPSNPVYLGIYNTNYVHDGYVENNIMYTAEIYAGQFCMVDVSTPASPVILGCVTTPFNFAHQVWISQDGTTAFVLDEKSNAVIAAYDITDPTNITLLDTWNDGISSVVMHNGYIVGDDFYTLSHYTSGITILDVSEPDIIVPIGNYDTSPNFSGGGYNGSWGNYPYLPSGNLIVTDREEGLHIFTTNYIPASYLQGCLTDVCTGEAIVNAQIDILTVNDEEVSSNNIGCYQTGIANCGNYDVTISASGYVTETVNINLNSDEFTTLDLALLPETGSCCDADAGDLVQPTGETTTIELCEGEDIGAFTNSYTNIFETNPGNDYSYAFIVTNGNNIIDYNTNGDFDWSVISAGTYTLYGFSYQNANAPSSVLIYLAAQSTISEINNDIGNAVICGDLDNLYADNTLVTIVVNALPTATVSSDVSICLNENTQLNASGGVSYSWSPSNGLSNINIANPIANPNITSTYTAVITDANGCETTDEVTVTVLPEVVITSVTPNAISVCEGSNGSINIIASSVTGGLQYSIDGGASFQTENVFSNLSAGTYNVVVENSAGCLVNYGEVLINPLNNDIVIDSITPSAISVCEGSDGSISIAASSAIGGLEYSIDGGTSFQTENVFSDLSAGTYNVVVENSAGCSIDYGEVIINPLNNDIVIDSVTPSAISTCDGSDGSISIAASSAIGGLQYSINGGASFQTENVFNDLSAGTYAVVVENSAGCSVNYGNVIINPLNNDIVIDSVTPSAVSVCEGSDGSISIAASSAIGGLQYSINGGASFQTENVFSDLSAGTYNIVVENNAGCFVNYGELIINPLNNDIVIDFVTSTAISVCEGSDGSISIAASSVTGGLQYSIDGGASFQNDATFSNLSAGTYNVVVENSAGCSIDYGEVIINPLNNDIVIDLVTPSAISTCDGSDGSIIITASSVTGGLQYSINGGASFQMENVFSDLSAGTYNIFVENSASCSVNYGEVIINPLNNDIVIDLVTSSAISVCEGSDGSISIVASSATGGLQYSIDGGESFQTESVFSDLSAGTYVVVVENSVGCSTNYGEIIINPFNNDIVIDSVTPSAISVCEGSDGSISITASSETGGLQYSIDGGISFQTENIFSDLSAGTYNVVVENSAGCLVNYGNVIINPLNDDIAIDSVTSSAISVCEGSDGSINIIASSATGGLQYSIDGGESFQTESVFSDLSAGTYNVVVENSAGCSTNYGNVIINPLNNDIVIDSVTPSDVSVCDGSDGSIIITASSAIGGLQYSINGGISFQTESVFNDLSAGTYDILVENNAGCLVNYGELIIEDFIPTLNIVSVEFSTITSCEAEDGEITINANGENIQYSIDGGNSFETNNIFTNLSSGVYEIVIMDIFNCTETYNETISIQTIENNILINDVIFTPISFCGLEDATITILAEGTNLIYSIDGGNNYSTNNEFTDLGAGNYNIIVQDEFICSEIYDTIIEIDDVDNIEFIDVETTNILCAEEENGVIEIFANAETELAYSIDGGTTWQVSSVFENIAEGTYNILIQTENTLCNYPVGEVEITSPSSLIIVSVADESISECGGNDGSIEIIALGGTGNLQYSIDDGASFQAENIFENLGAGTYQVMVADENNCTVTHLESIDLVDSELTVTINPISPVACVGEPVTLTANASENVVSYSWSNGENTSEIEVFVSEETSFTVAIENENGCIATETVTVGIDETANAIANFEVSSSSICLGETVLFNNVSENANEYQWSFEGGIPATSTEANPSVSYFEEGVYSATLTVLGCNGSDIFTIETAVEVSDLTFEPESYFYEICEGEDLQIDFTGEGIITAWTATNGSFDATTGLFSNIEENASLSLEVINNACVESIVIEVSILATPNIEAGEDIYICQGEELSFNAINPDPNSSYIWTINDIEYADGFSLFIDESTIATLSVLDNECASISETSIAISVAPGIENLTLSTDNENFCLGENAAILTATGGVDYNWSVLEGENEGILESDDPSIIFIQPTDTTTYLVEAINEWGCSAFDSITINVQICPEVSDGFYNVITPNADGVNDTWLISKYDEKLPDEVYLRIYNRWGQLVFEANSRYDEWDGKNLNGEVVGSGTYYFLLDLRDDKDLRSGTITVIK